MDKTQFQYKTKTNKQYNIEPPNREQVPRKKNKKQKERKENKQKGGGNDITTKEEKQCDTNNHQTILTSYKWIHGMSLSV